MKLSLFPEYRVIFLRELRRKLANRKIPCPLCGSQKSFLVAKSPNVHMAVFRRIFAERVVQCEACGMVFTNPRPSVKDLERYYTELYRLEGLEVPKTLDEFLGEGHKEIWFSKERDFELVLEEKSAGRLLDIGCASGSLLWLAHEKGFAVHGVDVGRVATQFVADILGFDVFCGQLEDAHFPDRSFDVVTMFHSLEHVPYPRPVVREIRRILADDGVFIGVVPNFAGWSSEKDGAKWIWLQPQNHYSHFTPDSLRKVVEGEGFSLRMRSEEGRYGDEKIQEIYNPSEVQTLFARMKGSEILFAARKK